MSISARFQLAREGFCLQVELAFPARGITALFGRSGSGKTTLLRCLAGLERVPGGRLQVGDQTWQAEGVFVPVHRRAVGYVFQEPSLFPHLRVAANLRYGLRRTPDGQQRVGFDEAVALLGLEPLLERYPDALSGGQRQRVAIGRALLASPRLLLMDEPMGSLDETSKQEILPWLERLHGALEIPVVYVSHAIDEVARLADYMVLLEQGRVLAQGPLQEVLTRADLPLAHAESASAVLDATVLREADDHLAELALGEARLIVSRGGLRAGQRIRVRILARDVALSREVPSRISTLNCLAVTVIDISDDPHPGHVLVRLALGEQLLLSRITRRSLHQLALEPGLAVQALIKGAVVN